MSEYAVMPKADWVDTLSAIREKTETDARLRSGEVAAIIRGYEAKLKVATGTFASNHSFATANISVSGLGFKPKHVIVMLKTQITIDRYYNNTERLIAAQDGLYNSHSYGFFFSQGVSGTYEARVACVVESTDLTITMTDDGFAFDSTLTSRYFAGEYAYIAIG